jgi:hypothetical protein
MPCLYNKHTMLIKTPVRETRECLILLLLVENVGSIRMDQDAMLIVFIKGVSANKGACDDQDSCQLRPIVEHRLLQQPALQ